MNALITKISRNYKAGELESQRKGELTEIP